MAFLSLSPKRGCWGRNAAHGHMHTKSVQPPLPLVYVQWYYLGNRLHILLLRIVLHIAYPTPDTSMQDHPPPLPPRDKTIPKIHWCSFHSFTRLNQEIILENNHFVILSGVFCITFSSQLWAASYPWKWFYWGIPKHNWGSWDILQV